LYEAFSHFSWQFKGHYAVKKTEWETAHTELVTSKSGGRDLAVKKWVCSGWLWVMNMCP